jgi:hypothetical protein
VRLDSEHRISDTADDSCGHYDGSAGSDDYDAAEAKADNHHAGNRAADAGPDACTAYGTTDSSANRAAHIAAAELHSRLQPMHPSGTRR